MTYEGLEVGRFGWSQGRKTEGCSCAIPAQSGSPLPSALQQHCGYTRRLPRAVAACCKPQAASTNRGKRTADGGEIQRPWLGARLERWGPRPWSGARSGGGGVHGQGRADKGVHGGEIQGGAGRADAGARRLRFSRVRGRTRKASVFRLHHAGDTTTPYLPFRCRDGLAW